VRVNLCQPGCGPSCAACCGLHAEPTLGRAEIEARLCVRTDTLNATARTMEAFWAATRGMLAHENRRFERLSEPVRLCPLVGFVDAARTRVGCLGHPAVTSGPDLRDCGALGAMTCEEFLCPSFGELTEAESCLVQQACPDWWLYGLVVTDAAFVRTCVDVVSEACGRKVTAGELGSSAASRSAMGALFALKLDAPRVFATRAGLGACGPERVLECLGMFVTTERLESVRELATKVGKVLATGDEQNRLE